jgi:hypothetical protein
MARFTAELHPIKGGGFYVEMSDAAVTRAGWKYGQRLRGTVGGAEVRTSLTRYSGIYHVGVPAAVVRALGAGAGTKLKVALEIDPDPPGERVPPDLAEAIAASRGAAAGWDAMSPAHRREHVKHVAEAKRPETRARRIAATVAALAEPARKRAK